MIKMVFITGAFSAALAIVLGAFGAHALKSQLSSEMLAVYNTAVQYHFYHSLGLLILGLIAMHIGAVPLWNWSAGLMLAGIVLFSGSLYILAISGMRVLGAVTPLGGLCFILSWLLLLVALWKAEV